MFVRVCKTGEEDEGESADAKMSRVKKKRGEKRGKWKADIKTKGEGDGVCDAADAQPPSIATRCHAQTHAGWLKRDLHAPNFFVA